MKRNAVLGWCLAIALGTAGCQNETTEPTAPPVQPGSELNQSVSQDFGLTRGPLKLPASGRITDQYIAEACRRAVGRAIDGDDYVCPSSTPVIDWWVAEVVKVIQQEPEIFDLLYNQLLADLVPTYEALYFQTEATPQYFGYNGEYTQLMQKTETDTKRFWDIKSDDIQLIGMHGTMLLDVERVARTYQLVFGLKAADAAAAAAAVRDAMLKSKTLNGGNHPLFSFNAFAFTTFGGPIPDKIVMGDGILAGYEALGFDDVAPQAIYAHEFAHHIQFENGYFDEPVPGTKRRVTEAEKTRYTELMADAFSAYFLTHSQGLALNKHRVEQFLEVFFQIGDCAFDNPGHHGTPNQRMAAARFGFSVADEAQKQGHVLTSEQFHARFVAVYPQLVAPDAT
jgi:hypothetical protein